MSDPQQDRMQTPPQHGGAESTTEHEFDAPGTNYPDTGKPDESTRDESGADAQPAPADNDPSHEAVGVGVIGGAQSDPDHHGQDGGREKVWAGSSQEALSGEQEQRLPSMSQNNASDVEKVTGIEAEVAYLFHGPLGLQTRDVTWKPEYRQAVKTSFETLKLLKKADSDIDLDRFVNDRFIRAAAGLLTGAGRLWMVANRHLPYEAALSELFADVQEIGGDNRFKVITATGAGRPKRR